MSKHSILLVDDEIVVLSSLQRDLTHNGFSVTTAENGEAAVARLEKQRYDIIITDLVMGGLDGIGVLNKAKELDPEAMVIILTGNSSVVSVLQAMQQGAFDYLVKPINREELVLRVARCAEKLDLRAQVKQRSVELEAANAELRQALEKHKLLEEALRENRDRLAESNKQLQLLAHQDGLTGITNRRSFDAYLEREWSLAQRQQTPVSLIFIDVDHFKLYNDSFGHQAGDDCLKKVAGAVTNTLKRPADMLARYGGEEFVAVLPGTGEAGAAALAEEMRIKVSALHIPHVDSGRVTISLGVATAVPAQGSPPAVLVKAADQALYVAKQSGRNRVVAARGLG